MRRQAPRLSDLTILIVDDDPEVRGLWKHMLDGKIPGLRTAEACDGEAAVREARQLQPDLIVMDVAMPKVNGFEATRRLKDDVATSRIPVVVVTGRVFSSMNALAAGCDGYLLKPLSPDQLIREVERLLARYAR